MHCHDALLHADALGVPHGQHVDQVPGRLKHLQRALVLLGVLSQRPALLDGDRGLQLRAARLAHQGDEASQLDIVAVVVGEGGTASC